LKVWQVLKTLIGGIIILYLQVLFMPKLAIGGIIPNLFLGWIVYQVWHKQMNMLIPILFVLGLCLDLTDPAQLGLQTILFIILAIGADEFHRPLEKDSYLTLALSVGLVCFLYSILLYFVFGLQSSFSGKLILLNLGLFFYNLVIALLVTFTCEFISHLRLDFRDE